MERNDESLSTRELVPQDPTAGPVPDPESEPRRREPQASDRAPMPGEDQMRAPASASGSGLETQAGEGGFATERPVREERNEPRLSSAEPQAARSQPSTTDDPKDPEAETHPNEPLMSAQLSASFQRRWEEVQTRFVDEPRGAVEDADGLVASVMQQLAEGFAQERERVEAQWGGGEDISTEDLRIALQRYRSFFHRLLST